MEFQRECRGVILATWSINIDERILGPDQLNWCWSRMNQRIINYSVSAYVFALLINSGENKCICLMEKIIFKPLKKCVKSHNLKVSGLDLQLSLSKHWGQVLSREWRCRWMFQLHLRYQQLYCLLRFDSKCIIYHVCIRFLARAMPKVRSHILGWVFVCVWKKHWLQPNSGMASVWLCDLRSQFPQAWVRNFVALYHRNAHATVCTNEWY